ncbi:hypothetical protein [uncultured Methylobacterium sp.]|uniref:hypothetical protein n=1 Tax=uncultured Methylobacterium sp. TaxID=157278 RepID=UPI0035C9DF21
MADDAERRALAEEIERHIALLLRAACRAGPTEEMIGAFAQCVMDGRGLILTALRPTDAGLREAEERMRKRAYAAVRKSIAEWRPHTEGGTDVDPREAEGAIIALHAVCAKINALPTTGDRNAG